MKAILLTAVLAGAGGAGIAILAAPRPAASSAAPTSVDPGGALASALAELRQEVAALRGELREGAHIRAAAGEGGAGAPGPSRPGSGTGGEAPSAAAPVVRSPGGAGPSEVPVTERLRPVRGWVHDAEVRARWTFLGEADVLERFGVPDRVHLDGGAERWTYRCPSGVMGEDGKEVVHRVTLVLHRGRLVEVLD